jgi:hypothetical protein
MADGSWCEQPLETDYDTVCEDVLTGSRYYALPTGFAARELMLQYGCATHYGVRKYQAARADIRRHVNKVR